MVMPAHEYELELEAEQSPLETNAIGLSPAGSARLAPALQRLALASARTIMREGLAQSEWELESEAEFEWESELNPIRRVYPDALMEHLGHAATETESEAEAEAFIGALVPLAARVVPRVAPAIMRAAPQMIRGLTRTARLLRRQPATRALVRTLPTILRRTAVSMARQAAQGQPVTPRTALRSLARQTAQVLSSPQQCAQVWRRSQRLDRQYHAAARTCARRTSRCPTCGR